MRIFGFPRKPRPAAYVPADDHDDDLKSILTKIGALAENAHWTSDRRWKIAELAAQGLKLLESRHQQGEQR